MWVRASKRRPLELVEVVVMAVSRHRFPLGKVVSLC